MSSEISAPRPALSIITPTRNSASTLERCLKSVTAQNFNNWEHWIIDSVSTDETVSIARRAARKDSRLHVLSEVDSGIYDAMNKGIVLARGEWIYFLGSDDELFDADTLSSIFDHGNIECDFLYGNVMRIPNQKLHDGPFDLNKIFTTNISHQAIFYRRELFERLGVFDLRFPVYADWEFNIKCMIDPTVRTQYIDTVIARFRLGGTSSNGKALDAGWIDEKLDLLGRRFKLDQPDRENFRSIVKELIQDEMADPAEPWRRRYKNLQHIHNDAINSYGFRLFRVLTWPARTVLLLLRRTRRRMRKP